MHVTPYIFFKGTCAEALKFYEAAAGAKTCYTMTYGATPAAEHVPAELKDKIINCAFTIGDTTVMASDGMPERWATVDGFALCIGTSSNEEAERLYAGLSAGGTIDMAMGETFFAHRFGQFTDKFGIPWMIIHEKKPS
jgi:PhnB protein